MKGCWEGADMDSRILLDFAIGQEGRDQGDFGQWSRTSIRYCQLAPGGLGYLFRESGPRRFLYSHS